MNEMSICTSDWKKLTLQSSWMAEISGLDSRGTILKTSDLICFQLIRIRPVRFLGEETDSSYGGGQGLVKTGERC